MTKKFNVRISLILCLFLALGCGGAKNKGNVEEPPGFFGRIMQNAIARYNGFYNADLIYTNSERSSIRGFSDNYYKLLPLTIADAVAESGAMGSQMEEILKKSTNNIQKYPYSKWVDDNYLLNGIAQYINGDYDKAIEVFAFTSAEFKNGVEFEKVGARQKYKKSDPRKLRKEQFKEKQRQQAVQKREKFNEAKDRKNSAKKKNKEREDGAKKNATKKLSKKEQFEARQKAKKTGRDVTIEEIVEEYEKNQIEEQDSKAAKKERTKAERRNVKNAPKLVNSEDRGEGFLAHPLAGKDALLWLAKTFITSENFLAAQNVLTAINGDPTFPKRLDKEYYLINADMHARLDNVDRAIEYVHLAIDATSKRKEKARLNYILGQLYREVGDAANSIIHFDLVEKFHPTYDMIYHAKRQSIAQRLASGEYSYEELVAELKKMRRDEKNDEFMDQVLYDLGQAHAALTNYEDALKNFEKSLEESKGDKALLGNTHLAMATIYYDNSDYETAGPSYTDAVSNLDKEDPRYSSAELRANALTKIIKGFENINRQDSLLQIAELSDEEINKLVKAKVTEQIKLERREKLKALISNSGSAAFTDKNSDNLTSGNSSEKKNKNEKGVWYFYDVNQSSAGYTDFQQTWGDRPLRDGWRRYDYIKRYITRAGKVTAEDKPRSKNDLYEQFLSEIPKTDYEKEDAYASINQSRLEIGRTFIEGIADYNKGIEQLEILVAAKPKEEILEEANHYLARGHHYNGNEVLANKYGGVATPKEEQQRDVALDALYDQAFNAFSLEDFDAAIVACVNAHDTFGKNDLSDKFAFIKAVAIGRTTDKETFKKELETFIETYTDSELKIRAQNIIVQLK